MSSRAKSARKSETPAAPEAPKETPASEAARKIRELKAQLGVGGGTAQIFRLETGKRPRYLDKVGIDELAQDPHELVRSRWGGGDYQVTLRDAGNLYIEGGSVQLSIGGPPAPEPDKFDELERKWDERVRAAQKGDASGPELVRFMFETMREQLRELRNPPAAAASGNPMEMAVAMVTAIQEANGPILEALLARKSEPARNRTEELRELLELVTLVQGLANNGTEKSSGLDRVIDKLADPLAGFFARAAPTTSGPPGAPPMLPPVPPPTTPANGRPAWFPLLERAIPSLLGWAKAAKDPELRADLVIDDLPDNLLGPVHEQLSRGEDFLAEFFANVPAAEASRQWFVAFFLRLRADLDTMYVDEESGEEKAPTVDSGVSPA
jgi:hypothetical protein